MSSIDWDVFSAPVVNTLMVYNRVWKVVLTSRDIVTHIWIWQTRVKVVVSRVTLYTTGHLHTAVPHCSHSRAPIVHTAVPRGCVCSSIHQSQITYFLTKIRLSKSPLLANTWHIEWRSYEGLATFPSYRPSRAHHNGGDCNATSVLQSYCWGFYRPTMNH